MAKKRRIRSPHPGVKLTRRKLVSGGFSWRAIFKRPDDGKVVAITLSRVTLSTAEARRQWAIQKSKSLERIRMDRAAGILPPRVGEPFEAAIEIYFDAASSRLRPRTVNVYRTAVGRLRSWLAHQPMALTSDLRPAHLMALRDYLVKLPRSGTRGGARRARPSAKEARAQRSMFTVNTELRALKTILRDWRKRELTPHLSRDDIADTLAALPVDREQPAFLPAAELATLLEAALEHDAATFLATRAELSGHGVPGTTRRYPPIAPLLAFVLLTGCRRGEALGLRWDIVDLNALDDSQNRIGEIRLPATGTKTRRARSIGLDVSPALRMLLVRMKLRARGDFVFGGHKPYTPGVVSGARKRLMETHGAPPFDWQLLRSTCATFLSNATGMFGASSAYRSSKQLGHSVTVAERHYVGLIRGIPHTAKTLEAAMRVENQVRDVIAAVQRAGFSSSPIANSQR